MRPSASQWPISSQRPSSSLQRHPAFSQSSSTRTEKMWGGEGAARSPRRTSRRHAATATSREAASAATFNLATDSVHGLCSHVFFCALLKKVPCLSISSTPLPDPPRHHAASIRCRSRAPTPSPSSGSCAASEGCPGRAPRSRLRGGWRRWGMGVGESRVRVQTRHAAPARLEVLCTGRAPRRSVLAVGPQVRRKVFCHALFFARDIFFRAIFAVIHVIWPRHISPHRPCYHARATPHTRRAPRRRGAAIDNFEVPLSMLLSFSLIGLNTELQQ